MSKPWTLPPFFFKCCIVKSNTLSSTVFTEGCPVLSDKCWVYLGGFEIRRAKHKANIFLVENKGTPELYPHIFCSNSAKDQETAKPPENVPALGFTNV